MPTIGTTSTVGSEATSGLFKRAFPLSRKLASASFFILKSDLTKLKAKVNRDNLCSWKNP